MDYAMQNNASHDDLAEIWKRAQHRRAVPKISIRGSRNSLNEPGNANQAPLRRFSAWKPHWPWGRWL